MPRCFRYISCCWRSTGAKSNRCGGRRARGARGGRESVRRTAGHPGRARMPGRRSPAQTCRRVEARRRAHGRRRCVRPRPTRQGRRGIARPCCRRSRVVPDGKDRRSADLVRRERRYQQPDRVAADHSLHHRRPRPPHPPTSPGRASTWVAEALADAVTGNTARHRPLTTPTVRSRSARRPRSSASQNPRSGNTFADNHESVDNC